VRRSLSFALALASVVPPGCIMVPVPVPEKSSRAFGGRQPDSPTLATALVNGASTREQLLLALGQPDRTWDSERFMVYRSETVRGRLLFFIDAGMEGAAGFAPLWGEQAFLLTEFDDAGTLRRHELRRRGLMTWGDELAVSCDEWAHGPPLPAPGHAAP
jgi:hypothetical protein